MPDRKGNPKEEILEIEDKKKKNQRANFRGKESILAHSQEERGKPHLLTITK